MDRLNENNISPLVSRGDFTRGIPFYGTNGDFNFTVSRSKFTPGISISQKAFVDLSIKGDKGYTDFDIAVSKLKLFYKPGDRIRGVVVNSMLDHETGVLVVGKLHKIVPDYTNNSIQVYIKNTKTLEIQEVYPETIERVYESTSAHVMSFSQFINS